MLTRTLVAALPVALVTALLLASPAGSAPVEHAALNIASFEDAAGDSGIAPDVTGVDVGNDVVAGPIVFWITLANRPDDLTADDGVVVFLDTDRNAATGDEEGFEYAIGVSSESFGLSRWDGTTYVDTSMASLSASFFKNAKALRVSIHPSELGGPTAFDFFVLGIAGEEFDLAPNGAPAWSYTLASGRPPLVVLGLSLNPKSPVAGRRLTATIAVGRGDTLDLLGQGKVTCTLLVGGKPVKAVRAGFAQGLPQCRWNIPASAKGKTFRGTVSVTFGGSTAKKAFSGRVK